MSVINKVLVLKLNKNWKLVGMSTVWKRQLLIWPAFLQSPLILNTKRMKMTITFLTNMDYLLMTPLE